MFRSIRWKLSFAFLLIVCVSVGLTAFLIGLGTRYEFQQYVTNCDVMYTNSLTNFLSDFYKVNNGWNNVESLLDQQVAPGERLVLTDHNGMVLADTGREWQGRMANDVGLYQFISISNSGKVIGRLYPLGCDCSGIASVISRSCSGTMIYSSAEQSYVDRVSNYLWMVGLITAAMALFLGLILTRQITNPVRALKKGAQQLSAGDLDYQVKVDSADELGDLAKSFNNMADSLNKMELSRRHLTADIAHELRTPLTVIEGTVDGMMDGVFKPDSEHLGWIKEQTGLLTRLIEDLRDLSQAEAGQLKLDFVPTDIVELIERKISQIKIRAQEKGITLELKEFDGIGEVEIDPLRIEQVINNLLINALRHTPEGGRIIVSIMPYKPEDNSDMDKKAILISVADTGEGIPPEHLDSVFERFYRIESSRTKEKGETGLGLAIVKQMVEYHGGKVWVESKQGKGTTFFIVLPLTKDGQ